MSPAELTMKLPADTRFISTARVVAASVGAELDFSIDEIDELQMAANELFSVLVDAAEDVNAPSIDVRYIVTDDTVEITGSVADVERLELDILAEQILASVADEHSAEGGTMRLLKRRATR